MHAVSPVTTSTGVDARPSDLTRRITAAFADPLATSVGPLRVPASVGIAVSEDEQDAGELLRHADKAMYRVKLGRPEATPLADRRA